MPKLQAICGSVFVGVMLTGCRSEMPFELVPIHGKVTYEDGGLIPADSITVTFNPVDAPTENGMTPPGAQTQLRVEDGTFDGVTTRRPNDGVLLGRHKVVVLSFDARADGRPVASKAAPEPYRKVQSTPIEVDIREPDQYLEIKIARP